MGAALALSLLLVAWGAWTLWTTMSRHRATADETLRDHAAYLSASYANSVQSRSYVDVRTLLRGAQRALVSTGRLTSDSLTAATGRDAFSPYVVNLAPLGYFVFDSITAQATSAGDTVQAAVAAALRRRLGKPRPKEATFFGAVVVHGADTTLAFVEREHGGSRWVGLELALPLYRDQILGPPLQPTLMAFERLRDSMRIASADSTTPPIAMQVTADDGIPLIRFNDVRQGSWTSTRSTYGALQGTIAWAILPPAVPVLMPGGYPPAPGARVVGAVALALLLLGGAAIVAWRAMAVTRLREEFTSNMSHELRTPLANIQLYAETLLLERAGDEASQRSALDTIVRETRHLGQMVENVLAMSRVGRPAHRLSPRPEQVERLVREAVALFEPLARQHRIRLEVAVAPGPVVSLDADAVRRILINLLDNAIRHGGDEGVVTVESRHDARHLELAVADQGPGVAPADRDRIWGAFERGDGNGSGIGLAVVHQLVLLHGGTVRIEPVTPHGARFRVSLPLAKGS